MGLFGGGNSSSSTSNLTTNNDNRQVITTTSSSYDLSDRSVNASTNIVTDGGAVQAIKDVAASVVGAAKDQTLAGYNYADHIFDTATVFANNTVLTAANAFDAAAQIQSDALTQARSAFAASQNTTAEAYAAAQKAQQSASAELKAAYADAKGTTDAQKQIILAVLAVAGVMALAMMRKG